MPTIEYGELLESNSYSTKWSGVSTEARTQLAHAYAVGGTDLLARTLKTLSLNIPVNTARGYMVRAGVKVKSLEPITQMVENRSQPRVYTMDIPVRAPKVAFIGDEQVPFNDKALTKKALAMIQDFAPHILIELGDTMDCYSVSRFTRDPRRRLSLATELVATREYLDQLDAAAAAGGNLQKKVYCFGNHEARLENFLVREAPSLVELPELQLASLLDLDGRGYEHYTYGQVVDYRGFTATHGWSTGPAAAMRMAQAVGRSGISGHVHQGGTYNWTDANGTHIWHVNGTLMAVNDICPDYTVGIVNWSQGITLGVWDGSQYTLTPVVAQNGKLLAPWGETY